jgi:monovalent cation/hydrogen antiporter
MLGMNLVIIAIFGVLAVVGVNALAPRLGVAAPLLLVLLGVGVSFIPRVGPIDINPELILAGILPPLLYSTAVAMPTMEFRRDFRTISVLSVVLVVVSAVVVGVIMHLLIPGLDLALGIALGAILSPTDAVATSIVRKAGVSQRIVTVLEGESLLNDASALVLLRSAVAAVGVGISFGEVSGQFVYSVIVAVAVGWAVGRLNLLVRSHLNQATSSVAVSLIVPFVAYVPAEQLNASGLVAAVTAGLISGHGAPARLRAEDRITERAVWRTVELLLESAVFLIMGLEISSLIADVRAEHDSVRIALVLGLVAAITIVVVRSVFIALSLWSLARRERRAGAVRERIDSVQQRIASEPLGPPPRRPGADAVEMERRTEARTGRFAAAMTRRIADLDYLAAERFGWREGVILVWAGMRGAVTLAAAQSLESGTPHRSLLILIAFIVAAGTLIVQGGTLPWLANRLGVAHHDPLEREEDRVALRTELVRAAATRLDDPTLTQPDGSAYDPAVVEGAREVLDQLGQDGPDEESARQRAERRNLRLELLVAQRDELLRIRDLGTYPFVVLEEALSQIDADQVGMELRQTS